jgi:hypothetical protein
MNGATAKKQQNEKLNTKDLKYREVTSLKERRKLKTQVLSCKS